MFHSQPLDDFREKWQAHQERTMTAERVVPCTRRVPQLGESGGFGVFRF